METKRRAEKRRTVEVEVEVEDEYGSQVIPDE